MDRRTFRGVLAAITLIGLVGRLAFVWIRKDANTGSVYLVGGDGADYLKMADRLVDGEGFVAGFRGVEQSGRPPLWPITLGGLRAIVGPASRLELQYLSALVGATTIPLTGWCGRRIVSPAVGLVAAALVAVYPGAFLWEWALLSETLLLPLICLTILAAYGYHDEPSRPRAALLGGWIGLLALTRPEQLMALAVVALPTIWWAAGARREKLLRMGITCLTVAAVILPWSAFNLTRFEEPVPISTGLGTTLAAGNCDTTYDGPLLGIYDSDCSLRLHVPLNRDPDADPSTNDPKLRSEAIDYMRDHLDRLPVVALARLGRVAAVYEPSVVVEHWAGWSLHPTEAVWTWIVMSWALVPVAVVGAVALRRAGRPLTPLLGFVLIVVVAVATTIGDIRYRAALEVPLVLLAAVGITRLVGRRRDAEPDVASVDRAEDLEPSGVAAPAAGVEDSVP